MGGAGRLRPEAPEKTMGAGRDGERARGITSTSRVLAAPQCGACLCSRTCTSHPGRGHRLASPGRAAGWESPAQVPLTQDCCLLGSLAEEGGGSICVLRDMSDPQAWDQAWPAASTRNIRQVIPNVLYSGISFLWGVLGVGE